MTTSNQTILLIDDDATLRDLLAEHLQTAGYKVLSAPDGTIGLKTFAQARPDLIVLDVMMPGMSGWEVCEQVRSKSVTPIILLTAKSEEIDKLRGFRLGVDDYVTKPFSFAEMIARVGAVLTRAQFGAAPMHSLTSGDLSMDFDQHRVTVSGQPVDLTRTEYRLLETLARHLNKTVATEQLIDEVWGPTYAGEVEQVKHFIWTLRKKIEIDPGDPKHLIT
ncbi:MAG TPA: response regulator transcription factor, partial [Anaerolineae bacterium]|nr:response regulator transcription factor [Anaerolineae bacterium]